MLLATHIPVSSVYITYIRHIHYITAGIVLGMGLANERRRYNVTPSLIGQAHTQTGPSKTIAGITQYGS